MPSADTMQLSEKTECTTPPGGLFEHLFCTFGVLGAFLLAVLSPGDVPWVNDEAMLIHKAYVANIDGTLAGRGLMGSQDVFYGPLPTWIYQAYLTVSHDLVALVALRAAAFVLVLAYGLLRIARITRLTPCAIPVLLLSPYLWLYSRQIWDNTFNIPLAVLSVLFYLEFLQGRRWALAGCIVTCGSMLLVHLMSVPMVAAIGLHALIHEPRRVWASRWYCCGGVLVVAAMGGHYFAAVYPEIQRSSPAPFDAAKAVMFSLAGGQWFSLSGWVKLVGAEWWTAAPLTLKLLSQATLVAHAFVLAGLALAAAVIWPGAKTDGNSLRRSVAFISVATIVIQTVYLGARGAVGEPHYYNGSWFAYAGLIWLSVDWLSHRRVLQYVPIAWAAVLLLSVSMLSSQLHRTHGSRSIHYGPTLANQIDIARILKGLHKECTIDFGPESIRYMPHRLLTLMDLYDRIDFPETATARRAFIVPSTDDPRDGAVRLLVDDRPTAAVN